jgi:hypothetical protein
MAVFYPFGHPTPYAYGEEIEEKVEKEKVGNRRRELAVPCWWRVAFPLAKTVMPLFGRQVENSSIKLLALTL